MPRRHSRLLLPFFLGLATAWPALADEITFTGQLGHDVSLPGLSERLATIPISAASMAVAVTGTPEPMVSMHRLSQTAIVEGIHGERFPGLRDIPSDIVGEGFMPNAEALLTVDPDLVLQWGTREPDIVQPLDAPGFTVATDAIPPQPSYRLEFEGTSFREYYCGVTLRMTNESDETLTEINGFVASMKDGEQVGRSRGMSFLNLAPRESGSALFEAPHAPCDEATEYVFIVGACRFGPGFSPQDECAARIVGVAPVAETAGTP
ncbi:TroA family protein [Rhodophyticola porphyridii]|uniref:Uncharacterized protein n=1 Tax=Rhodophyticola porphyridii TaxID=1852017 RepID=A0A3L9YER1_9RHOB|nr:hypothetical protein [Rhodophyticola porphyridii]RMA41440.1 hypothetical protein D9R08_14070 [Rhodophyticola porphyridii]